LALVETFRVRTVVLREEFIREFVALWPGAVALAEPAVRQVWLELLVALEQRWRGVFATVALEHYRAMAEADIEAVPTSVLAGTAVAPPLVVGELVGAMSVLVFGVLDRRGRREALLERPGDGAALDGRAVRLRRIEGRLLTQAAEGAARLAVNGGREAVEQVVRQDRHALGWMRVTDGDPCAFCAMLASRGAVYKSAESAGFELDPVRGEINRYHDNCGCQVVPVFTRTPVLPETTQRAEQLWRDSQRAARAAGELERGTSNDALNALRRHMAGAGGE
jgi:hypothetical protein